MQNKKNILVSILFSLLLLLLCGCGCSIETVEEHNSKIEKEADQRRGALESMLSSKEACESADLNESEQFQDTTVGSTVESDIFISQNKDTVNETPDSEYHNQSTEKSSETGSKHTQSETGQVQSGSGEAPAEQSPTEITQVQSASNQSQTDKTTVQNPIKESQSDTSQTQTSKPVATSSSQGQTVTEQVQTTAPYILVHITITCSKVIDNPDLSTDATLPDDGIILDTYVAVRDGDSVFTALKAAADDNNISLSYTGSSGSLYVRGIGGLNEKQCGRFSGWKYSVNNEYPNVGCGGYSLSDGDSILFGYVANYADTY